MEWIQPIHADDPDIVFQHASDTTYFADPAFDQTLVKKWMVAPRALGLALQFPVEPTAEMIFGSAMHSLTLGSGPQVVQGNTNQSTHTMICLPEKKYQLACRMYDYGPSAFFTPDQGDAEIMLRVRDPQSGLLLKGKADWLPSTPDEDSVYRIVDYKTTSKTVDDMSSLIFDPDLRYDIQAVFYMRLFRLITGFDGMLGFRWIIQTKKEPYNNATITFDETNDYYEETNSQLSHALCELANYVNEHGDSWKTDLLTEDIPLVNLGCAEPTAWQIRALCLNSSIH